ncbi:MAG: YlmC/YmxH family sporulation protein [Firmicutes bacterium]|uniref:Sporulation protein, YlmC/YmxH family n=1 Tax=Melghirimyces thermohalophilus TaxID=1236220 RepID=A0A1G6J1T9_9BACL|nr:YlmC/YmxH family sporulation protein [Melghirimyces thermohalophilus]MDA8352364.1 YlmC/YmxH family sporulation protein [Bacillota bacterium]SDC12711.1 sporulation protein, YlmC/YmxH family [Melghirimyces thermohalophilus]
MRWSEFAEKELIDVGGGERIGNVGQADLLIDPQTGEIRSLLLPVGSSWFGKKQGTREINWGHIKKIGPEMVIVETGSGLYHR